MSRQTLYMYMNHFTGSLQVANHKYDDDPYLLPIGSMLVEIPDDTIPSKKTLETMWYNHKLKCKQKEIEAAKAQLFQKEQEYKDMLALPSGSVVADFDDGVPF